MGDKVRNTYRKEEIPLLRDEWARAGERVRQLTGAEEGEDIIPSDELIDARAACDNAAYVLASAELDAGQDLEEAFEILNDLANRDDTRAILCFARLFEQGGLYEQDYNKAMECYEWAAELGEAQAAFHLGKFYRLGLGVPVNLKKAAKYFARACGRMGDSMEAEYQLAVILFELKEGARGAALLKKCAEHGMKEARYDYAMCLLYGDGVKRSVRRAVAILDALWREGDEEAGAKLAYMYSAGFGVRPNPEKAANYGRSAYGLG